MVGSAAMLLLFCLPFLSISVSFPVQRADKLTTSVDVISPAKNGSNKVIVKSSSKVHSQALTNSACANFAESSSSFITVTFNSVTYTNILRAFTVSQLADDAPNPSASFVISDFGLILSSETVAFDGFCPLASSDFNLLIVGPKSQTPLSTDLTINFFTGVGANKCSYTPGNAIRVFFVNVVRSFGIYYHSELRPTMAEAFLSPVTSTAFNQASTYDANIGFTVSNLYTYVSFKPTVGPASCFVCLLFGSTGSGAIWLTFFGTDSVPEFSQHSRSTPQFAVYPSCSTTTDCVTSGSAPSSPTPLPVGPPAVSPTAFPTSTEPGVNLISSCTTSFLDVFFPAGSYRVRCSFVDICTGAVIGCPLSGSSILSTSSICTAARVVGIREGQTFTLVHTGRVDSVSGCSANGVITIPNPTPFDFSFRIETDGSPGLSPTVPPNFQSQQSSGSDSGPGAAAIAGGVVGGAVAIAGLLVVVYFFSRHRANLAQSKKQATIRHRDDNTDTKVEMMGVVDDGTTVNGNASNTRLSAVGNALGYMIGSSVPSIPSLPSQGGTDRRAIIPSNVPRAPPRSVSSKPKGAKKSTKSNLTSRVKSAVRSVVKTSAREIANMEEKPPEYSEGNHSGDAVGFRHNVPF
ncbi:hypothetical protein AAMO2058_000681800 [Amorphochlora amoebiformis]